MRKELQMKKFKIDNKNIMTLIGGYVQDTDDLELFIYYNIDTPKEKHVSYNLDKKYSLYGTEKQITEKQAQKIGFKPVSVVVNKYDKVAYMPETGEITLKVVADKITGLLLGAQAVGSIGADKRVNTVTSGLIGHLTVEQFSRNDLTYSPAYSPTIDPLLNAMQILCNKLSRSC